MIELIGRLTPADRARSEFPTIPFGVPAGANALHVTATIGERLWVSDGASVEVVVTIAGDATGTSIRLLSDKGLEAVVGPLEAADPGIHRFALPAHGRGLIRVELDHPDGGLAALTNPIYLRET